MAWLVASFATFITAHVTLVVGLAVRGPRRFSRSALALIVLPLAPYWGMRAGMGARSALWVLGACGYAISRRLAGH
ncbi:MAG: hypothetical protein ACREJ3_08330 [Polyangiaceae bacterium]